MKRRSIGRTGWKALLAIGIVVVGAPIANSTLIVFDFNDGEGWDNPAVIGATMTADGVTATIEDILGWDGSAFTWNSVGGEHRMNINGSVNALAVNSAVSQGFETEESRDMDAGEAFRFSFDTDIYLTEMNPASLDNAAEMTISSSVFSDVVITSADPDPFDLAYRFVPVGTVITIANTAPLATGNEFRITELTIDTVPEPATLGLVAIGGGLLFMRRRLRV